MQVDAHVGKFTGENASNWQGGLTKLRKIIRTRHEYRQWRSDVYTRDEFFCQKCNTKGEKLNAHHIKSFNIMLEENNIKTIEEALDCEEFWNINNGITMCEKCHRIFHKKYGYKNDLNQLLKFLN